MEQTDRIETRSANRAADRDIVRLAVPAFLALVAEPLFLLSDAAIVGHLGTAQLAGLGVAGAVLQTAVGLCIFLAYGTTAAVARQVGAGHPAQALRDGIDGLWLAVLIGVLVTAVGIPLAEPLAALFGAGPAVLDQATTYLRLAFLGTTPLLLMLAATGVLRGLQDTRTPLVVAVAANLLNIVLNLLLVYPAGLGIAGSAIGSVLAQVAAAGALVAVVLRAARRQGLSPIPHRSGVAQAARAGVPLVLRTLTLRAALLVTVWSATRLGDDHLAAHQVAITLWAFLAFALDAIAIAAQAITGRALGAGDIDATRRLTRRMLQWGLVSGIVSGLGLAAVAPVIGHLFTTDPSVLDLLPAVLLVAAVFQPLAGVVFVLDGILIGAGDGRFLAWAMLAALAAYAPLAIGASRLDLVWLWVTFAGVFMAARAVVLLARARGGAWLVTGAGVPAAASRD